MLISHDNDDCDDKRRFDLANYTMICTVNINSSSTCTLRSFISSTSPNAHLISISLILRSKILKNLFNRGLLMVYNIKDHECVDETHGVCLFRKVNVSLCNFESSNHELQFNDLQC